MFKEFNIRRHYETRHRGQYASLQGQVRRDKVANLKSGLAATAEYTATPNSDEHVIRSGQLQGS